MPWVRLVKGDIRRQRADVVADAANRSLMGGGGGDTTLAASEAASKELRT